MPESVVIRGMPLPPSVNACYRNVPGVGRVATKDLRAFKEALRRWAVVNARNILSVRRLLGGAWALDVSAVCLVRRERIVTKSGEPKRLDTANFEKALHDGLADILGIDDRRFWSVHATKIPADAWRRSEGVDVRLTVIGSEADAIGAAPFSPDLDLARAGDGATSYVQCSTKAS